MEWLGLKQVWTLFSEAKPGLEEKQKATLHGKNRIITIHQNMPTQTTYAQSNNLQDSDVGKKKNFHHFCLLWLAIHDREGHLVGKKERHEASCNSGKDGLRTLRWKLMIKIVMTNGVVLQLSSQVLRAEANSAFEVYDCGEWNYIFFSPFNKMQFYKGRTRFKTKVKPNQSVR